MMKRQTLLLIAIFVAVLTITAAPRTKAQMKEAAAKAINGERLKKRMATKDASEMKTLKEDEGYEIIGMERGNFAVIAKDDVAPAVLGVSMKRFNAENTNFGWWLKAVNEVVKEAAAKGIPLTATVPDATKYPTQVGPLMTTEWDQLEPYKYTTRRASRRVLPLPPPSRTTTTTGTICWTITTTAPTTMRRHWQWQRSCATAAWLRTCSTAAIRKTAAVPTHRMLPRDCAPTSD